jgi:hypothetical protein
VFALTWLEIVPAVLVTAAPPAFHCQATKVEPLLFNVFVRDVVPILKPLELKALKYGEVFIKLLVKDKKTGLCDTFSWTPDCSAAEAYCGDLDNDYSCSINHAVMDYMIENILDKLPTALAEEDDFEIIENL